MKFLKFILILGVILLLSAFLAPWIYAIHPAFKFERIMSRLVMIFSLIAIFSFVRLSLADLYSYGLRWQAGSRKQLLTGFLTGVVTLSALTAFLLLIGGRAWNDNWVVWWKVPIKLIEYLFAALLIGFLEEFFFRGFLFTQCRKGLTVFWSLVSTNLIYAALHFFKKGGHAIPEHPTFVDSLQVLLHLGDAYREPLSVIPTFVGLFLFGWILSYATLRTKSLFLSIGVHAGSVFFLKIDGWFIASVPGASGWLYGDKNLHSGLIGWCFLGLLLLFIWAWTRRQSRVL